MENSKFKFYWKEEKGGEAGPRGRVWLFGAKDDRRGGAIGASAHFQ